MMIQSYRYGPSLGVWVDGRPRQAPFGFSSRSAVADAVDAVPGGIDAEIVIGALIAEAWGRVLRRLGSALCAKRESPTHEHLAQNNVRFGFLDVGTMARVAWVYAGMQREIEQENET